MVLGLVVVLARGGAETAEVRAQHRAAGGAGATRARTPADPAGGMMIARIARDPLCMSSSHRNGVLPSSRMEDIGKRLPFWKTEEPLLVSVDMP